MIYKEFYTKIVTELTDEEVWLRIYTTTTATTDAYKRPGVAADKADTGLKEFKERFKNERE